MKKLWEHIAHCRDQNCTVQHCLSSKCILSHYRRCTDVRCPVCGPVREAIRKSLRRKEGGGGAATTNTVGGADRQKFVMFARVLLKYLEQKDPGLCLEVRAIITSCAERCRRREPGYEGSVTATLERELKKVVSDNHWKRAKHHLERFLAIKKAGNQQQQQQQQQGPSGSAGARTGRRTMVSLSSLRQKKKAAELDRQRCQAAEKERVEAQVESTMHELESMYI
jgi:hypothetical protein